MTTTKVYIGAVGEAFNTVIDAKAAFEQAKKNVQDADQLLENANAAKENAINAKNLASDTLDHARTALNQLNEAIRVYADTNPTLYEKFSALLADVERDDNDDEITYKEDGSIDNGGNVVTADKILQLLDAMLNPENGIITKNVQAAEDYCNTTRTDRDAAEAALNEATEAFNGMIPEDLPAPTVVPESDDVEADIAEQTKKINEDVDKANYISNGVESTTQMILDELDNADEGDDDSQGIDDDPVEPVDPTEPWYYYISIADDNEETAKDDVRNLSNILAGNESLISDQMMTVTGNSVTVDVHENAQWFCIVAPTDYRIECVASIPPTIGEYSFDPDEDDNPIVFTVNGVEYKSHLARTMFDEENPEVRVSVTITKQ